MGELFAAKVRRIGSSVGLLIPKERLAAMGAEVGDIVEVGILQHRDPKEIAEGFGMARHFRAPFQRDKKTRML